MGLEKQGAKPSGLIGKIVGRLMNRFHTSLYVDYFKNTLPKDNSKILDIGCGGGEFLRFLYDSNESYILYGLDHSPEMIELSAKINKRAIEQNRLKLLQSSPTDISLENSYLDLVTAFETVQFWTDIEKSFLEIYRLLKAGGQFLIINRYPPEGSKWWKIAKIKNDKDYIHKLVNAGFSEISVDLEFKYGWIIVKATK
ncbi:MAG: class I SAM-dependent methyltransferase [Bacteroidales bacterium]|nr:class I SAM-dependent methyltransferase [Bacteroidales bacterium]